MFTFFTISSSQPVNLIIEHTIIEFMLQIVNFSAIFPAFNQVNYTMKYHYINFLLERTCKNKSGGAPLKLNDFQDLKEDFFIVFLYLERNKYDDDLRSS